MHERWASEIIATEDFPVFGHFTTRTTHTRLLLLVQTTIHAHWSRIRHTPRPAKNLASKLSTVWNGRDR
jgi:hypothetical protein